jgi:methionyl-tRNA formyltransferase
VTTRARTVFLGSGGFGVPVLEALVSHPSVEVVSVVTAPTRPGSRGRPTDPPVAEWAAAHGLPMLRPARLRSHEAVSELAALDPELLVLADYGQIVPQAVLDLPRNGALNLHPSLLPRHRGASPIPAAILAGDEETGVSLMLMDAGLDTGPVVAQVRHSLSGKETTPDLEADLAELAASLLTDRLDDFLGGSAWPTEQDESGATVTRALHRSDGLLDPSKSAAQLERQVRAYQPWPGTFFETTDGRVIVWKAQVARGSAAPGTIVDGPAVATSDGLLELVEVQPAGGRRMSGAELVRGRSGLIGSVIE